MNSSAFARRFFVACDGAVTRAPDARFSDETERYQEAKVMLSRSIRRRRRLPAALLAVTMLMVTTGGLAVDTATASADSDTVAQAASENWAGYVVKSSTGSSFSTVSGSWVQPTVTSSSSSTSGYSAFWVGLGGSSGESGSLEQTGTAGEWVNGQAVYYAWYELLPAAQVKLDLAIHAGDHMSGSVTVQGSSVTIHLVDETSGGSVTKTLSMSNPDTSSAEWIAEAPAAQSQSGDYQTLPLANFGTVTFTGASATAGGHTGAISDSNWTAEQVNLVSADGSAIAYPGAQGFDPASAVSASGASAAASASSLSSDGTSFSVSYQAPSDSGASQRDPQQATGSSGDGYGYGGYGSGRYGYGYGGYGNGGYGYGGSGDGGYGPPGFLQ
jgi:hypothetical protein